MKKKLIGENIDPQCEYCKNGNPAADGKHILCERFGIMDINYSCKKFVYDPLKRIPRHPNNTQEFSAEDFKL